MKENSRFKFRAWDYESERWVYGYYTKLVEGIRKYDAIVSEDGGSLVRYYIDDIKTLGQYTGLKDKNIEVYHKDIGTDKFGKRVIVEWNEEHLCFGLLTIDEAVKDEWNFCLRDLKEIIGNIYENPELLEDKQ